MTVGRCLSKGPWHATWATFHSATKLALDDHFGGRSSDPPKPKRFGPCTSAQEQGSPGGLGRRWPIASARIWPSVGLAAVPRLHKCDCVDWASRSNRSAVPAVGCLERQTMPRLAGPCWGSRKISQDCSVRRDRWILRRTHRLSPPNWLAVRRDVFVAKLACPAHLPTPIRGGVRLGGLVQSLTKRVRSRGRLRGASRHRAAQSLGVEGHAGLAAPTWMGNACSRAHGRRPG